MVRRLIFTLLVCAFAAVAGAAVVFKLLRRPPPRLPDPPSLVVQMRDVARLETLDVSLYKKVTFQEEPQPADSIWGDVWNWAKFSLRRAKGRAIVFADVHIGLDLSKLDETSVQVDGDVVYVKLPPLQCQVELKPGETEVIGSNLDSAQTAELFELAKKAFEREALNDPKLRARAKASSERALRALLVTLGFREVIFVETLPLVGIKAG